MSAGSWHGGVQLVFAAVKAPLLFMIPLAVCLPAMRVLLETEGQELSHTKVALAGLVGMARAGMLSAALSPVLWLFLSLHPSYASAALWLAGTLALAGLPGLVTIARILAPPRRRLPAVLVSVLLLGATTAQTGWLLRPFIALPHAEVTFLRPLEHDIAHASVPPQPLGRATPGASAMSPLPSGAWLALGRLGAGLVVGALLHDAATRETRASQPYGPGRSCFRSCTRCLPQARVPWASASRAPSMRSPRPSASTRRVTIWAPWRTFAPPCWPPRPASPGSTASSPSTAPCHATTPAPPWTPWSVPAPTPVTNWSASSTRSSSYASKWTACTARTVHAHPSHPHHPSCPCRHPGRALRPLARHTHARCRRPRGNGRNMSPLLLGAPMPAARILVTDDDPHLREVVRYALARQGYEVLEATHGREALDILRREQSTSVLVLCKLDGLDLSTAPCLLQRAGRVSGPERGEFDSGWTRIGDDYVTKPFSPASS